MSAHTIAFTFIKFLYLQVFLSQIYRRANLLNGEFQQWVVSVIQAHAAVVETSKSDIEHELEGFEELLNEPLDEKEVPESEIEKQGPQRKSSLQSEPGRIDNQGPGRKSSLKSDSESSELRPSATLTFITKLSSSLSLESEENTTRLNSSPSVRRARDLGLSKFGSGLSTLKGRIGSIGFSRNSSVRKNSQREETASQTTGSQAAKMAISVTCSFQDQIHSLVDVYSAPVKTMERMNEKVLEYIKEENGENWPLCANILDPVRASVVCNGPSEILQVFSWFAGTCPAVGGDAHETAGTTVRLAPVCRVKNKFAFRKEELVGG